MKKLFFTIVLLLLGGTALAQPQVQFGLRFNPLISWAIYQDENQEPVEIDKGARIGYSYGLEANFAFAQNYFIHSGVLIVQKGFRFNDSTASNLDWRVTSVEVPIAFKLLSKDLGGGFFIKGLFGASLDFQVGYRREFREPGTNEIRVTRDNKEINTFGASFLIGLGADVAFEGAGAITMGVTYHQGLTNLNNRSNSALGETIIRISYMSLDLGYLF